jgi:hypothetical protein
MDKLTVLRFQEIFTGMSNAYGEYILDPDVEESLEVGVKVKGRATTYTDRVQTDLYEHHLRGSIGLGIVPIRENNTCTWGAIDLDDYTIDFKDVVKTLAQWPVVPCRSKSGGLHIYLFTKQPVTATDMRKKLTELSVTIGHATNATTNRPVEIFPKQTEAVNNAVGSWINLPYFGADKTVRFAYTENFESMPLDYFLQVVEETALSKSEFKSLEFVETPEDTIFDDLPPCLAVLAAKRGFLPSVQHNGLFNLAVAIRKKYPAEWKDVVRGLNTKYFTPPVELPHLEQVLATIERKEYSYMCKEPPINAVCNKPVCLKLKYGVGRENPVSDIFESATMIRVAGDPPMYLIQLVDGKTLTFESSNDMLTKKVFMAQCLDRGIFLPKITPGQLEELISTLAQTARTEMPVYDVTYKGRLHRMLHTFLSFHSTEHNRLEEGMAWVDGERTFFHINDFLAFAREHDPEKRKDTFVLKHLVQYQLAESVSETELPSKKKVWSISTAVWQDPDTDPSPKH